MAVHNMNLNIEPFNSIANGTKSIELRLNDEKRQKIIIGDTILFTCAVTDSTITATVVNLYKYVSFKELYSHLPLQKCGYIDSDVSQEKYTDMFAYYTQEQIDKCGVVGIELDGVVVSSNCT